MNRKKLLAKKKNKLIIVGSAFGVNRFFITNKIIEQIESKTINTGSLIRELIKNFKLNDFENLTLKEYSCIIEPSIISSIQNYLEYTNVILDTHFYYLVPALSMESLLKLKGYVEEIVLVLVEENITEIFKKNKNSSNPWFKNIKNIEGDVMMNRNYIDFYEQIIKEFSKVKKIKINLTKENIKEINLSIKI